MASLRFVEKDWVALYDRLRDDPNFSAQISPLFLSVRARASRSMLYVGKATNDWYSDEEISTDRNKNDVIAMRIRERHDFTEHFIREEVPTYRGAFWPFARKLNAAAAEKWNLPVEHPIQHITWSNICKIGAAKGNPEGHLKRVQSDLAIATLRAEIEAYKPELVVFVTWDYAWDLVKQVFETTDESWNQTADKDSMWWRGPINGFPAVLLAAHPQGKPRNVTDKWLAKALELLPT